MSEKQITTVTIFKFSGFINKFFALVSMAYFIRAIASTRGLTFAKLMGSGSKDGFSVLPDLSQYVLLCVWVCEADAAVFFSKSPEYQRYIRHCSTKQSIYLRTTMVHGLWSKVVPFKVSENYNAALPVAVLTRATIKWKDMIRFWKDVPAVSNSLKDGKRPLFAAGIGELPFRYQATFSIWKNGDDMRAFAYHNKHHKDMVAKTKSTGWYSEELFARFSPYKTEGDPILSANF